MNCCRCPQPAEAWMTFEYATGRVELFELPEDGDGYGGYAMCQRHADRLTPPVGWSLTDSRSAMLTLFPVAEVSQPPAPVVDVA